MQSICRASPLAGRHSASWCRRCRAIGACAHHPRQPKVDARPPGRSLDLVDHEPHTLLGVLDMLRSMPRVPYAPGQASRLHGPTGRHRKKGRQDDPHQHSEWMNEELGNIVRRSSLPGTSAGNRPSMPSRSACGCSRRRNDREDRGQGDSVRRVRVQRNGIRRSSVGAPQLFPSDHYAPSSWLWIPDSRISHPNHYARSQHPMGDGRSPRTIAHCWATYRALHADERLDRGARPEPDWKA